MRRPLARAAAAAARPVRGADRVVRRLSATRTVLVEARTPMNLAVLLPVIDALRSDPRLRLRVTGAEREDLRAAVDDAGLRDRWIPRARVRWMRVDLYMNADPWEAVTLRRAVRQMNFFHGVAGKYNLDCPAGLPLGFERYDAVAFPNAERLRNYVAAGIVAEERAALVGYPKADALVHPVRTAAHAAAALGLDPARRSVIYAPTFSPASSLSVAGEAIVAQLLDAGHNVIAKLHDRSLDSDARYTGGVDWRARLARFGDPSRFHFATGGDSTPYVHAADLMVTDHSSIGFEFCALDRPLVVFDVPGLIEAARINPAKVALLRSAAVVVATVDGLAAAVARELAEPGRLAAARRAAAGEVFHQPGSATRRAVDLIYQLLELSPARHPAAIPAAGVWSQS